MSRLRGVLASLPGWDPRRAKVRRLKGGITNENFRVDLGPRSCVVRFAGEGSAALGIDRRREHACAAAAARLGVAPELLAFLPERRALVTSFVPGRPLDPRRAARPSVLRRVAAAVRTIHAGPRFPGRFSPFDTVRDYHARARKLGARDFPGALARMAELESALRPFSPARPCHNDLLGGNLLDDGRRIWILDWEYAAMGDPFFDLGNFAANLRLGDEACRFLLREYSGSCPEKALRRLKLYRAASDLREAFWGFLQAAVSKLDFDFAAYGERHLRRFMKAGLAALIGAAPLAGFAQEPGGGLEPRARLRELGIAVGRMAPGRHNAITDVAGVKVGHVTLNRGEGKLVPGKGPVRTGVTAILPHGGDLWREKVPAATWVLNGTGEMTGSIWVNTQGALEVPIVLTNTMSVGRAMEGVVAYMLERYPEIGVSDDVVAPTVGECDDSSLNDARGLHVAVEDVARAIETASGGPVAEGAVGAGTGMIAFEFKAGIGTASRVLDAQRGGWTVGALVNANMGRREELTVAGVPVGEKIPELLPKLVSDGSIIVVLATDAPLDHLKLQRLASKAALGLARTGARSSHGSGDIFLAFSTGNRVPHYPKERTYALSVVADAHLTPLFEAAQEAVEEAILNSLTAARTTSGRDGNTAYALPLERLKAVLGR